MLNRGVFSEINGCVSTGKEANVYHAQAPGGAELAIKIYKTSILVFKDRDRWVGLWVAAWWTRRNARGWLGGRQVCMVSSLQGDFAGACTKAASRGNRRLKQVQ